MNKEQIKKGIQGMRPASIVRPFVSEEKIILRDYLAMQRTTLANERTLFAYIRTSLYLILGGIGLIEVDVFSSLQWAGYLALFISAFLIIHGFVRYLALRRSLKRHYKRVDVFDQVKTDRSEGSV